MLKRGVTSTTETVKKMGICDLNLITKPLDKLCVVHSFKRTTPPLLSHLHVYSWKVSQDTRKPIICYVPLA